MFVSCYLTNPVLTPPPPQNYCIFWHNKRRKMENVFFDSCELTSNQIDNYKTCLSLSCKNLMYVMHYNYLKINLKKKKKSWPNDPIIFSYVTGNKHIFLFGLNLW